MKRIKVLAVALLATSGFVGASAHAVPWVGSANYYTPVLTPLGNDEEVVGPFDSYDFGAGVVLMEKSASQPGPSGTTSYDGYYQSFVTKHELNGNTASAPLLDNTYELTVIADFKQNVSVISPSVTQSAVQSGTFSLYRDTTPDRSFVLDSGFSDGAPAIMSGSIVGGSGTASSDANGNITGVTYLDIKVTYYDPTVFVPGTINGADGIFTLRLDTSGTGFPSGVNSVQSHSYDPSSGDLLFAADGYATLSAVPEAETYGMMLAGLGLIGFIVRRRNAT